ncbi:hypothetical protein LOZ65_004207 [Ophidiomyces ophidiicola]|nr:hypothetical protein LOZ65_004207 [Ophidiomyces ophidiicola]
MQPDKCLKVDEFSGTIGEGENAVEITWKDKAQDRLTDNAEQLATTRDRVKAIAEHLAYHTALRLKKPKAVILYTQHFHIYISMETKLIFSRNGLNNTTTNIKTGVVSADLLHVTVSFKPGKFVAHIYVGNCGEGETAFDNLTVDGESVVDGRVNCLIKSLSVGTYPIRHEVKN